MDNGSRGSPRIRITMRSVEEKKNIAATFDLKDAFIISHGCNQPIVEPPEL